MIEFSLVEKGHSKAIDILIVPFFLGDEKTESPFLSAGDSLSIRSALASGDFTGKEQECLILYPQEGKDKRIALVGLGDKKECDLAAFRLIGALLGKLAKQKKATTLHIIVPKTFGVKTSAQFVEGLIEGILLGSYRFENTKGKNAKESPVDLQAVYFSGIKKDLLKKAKRIALITDAVNFTRDLVNGNADAIHSESLPAFAKELSKEYPSIKVHVLGKKQLEKEKMGLILAVNRAAVLDPALIVLEYKGKPSSSEVTGLVGKGVTFDTGGLNLKGPGAGMETMKCDMAGAGAVLGTFKAAAALKLKVNLIGIVPVVENAIGPLSYKPGDVYLSHSGKTVEITNTDAEGRLILADALTYLQAHFSPTCIIDLATLTGGIVIALGEEAAGLFTNDKALAKNLVSAGERSGDLAWHMPLYKAYTEMMKSKIADLKNSAGRKASSGTGAAFIQEFIRKQDGAAIPWAHLDIASTAYLDEPKGLHPTHATGAGVRLLIEYFDPQK